jgi:hypothetical protein
MVSDSRYADRRFRGAYDLKELQSSKRGTAHECSRVTKIGDAGINRTRS